MVNLSERPQKPSIELKLFETARSFRVNRNGFKLATCHPRRFYKPSPPSRGSVLQELLGKSISQVFLRIAS
jgi:hypothetical protein